MSRIKPTYANVMSTAAVFIALGGTSYAAVTLSANSVGNAELKADAVTTDKVKDGTLLSGDFKPGQLLAGPKGATGATGAKGATGATGPVGPVGPVGPTGLSGTSIVYGAVATGVSIGGSTGFVTALSKYVPAGAYAVTAKLWLQDTQFTGDDVYATCELRQSGGVIDITSGSTEDQDAIPIALQGIVPNYGGGYLDVICRESGSSNGVVMNDVKLSAIKVNYNS